MKIKLEVQNVHMTDMHANKGGALLLTREDDEVRPRSRFPEGSTTTGGIDSFHPFNLIWHIQSRNFLRVPT